MENHNNHANHAIGCSVTDCAHHCKEQQYCSLGEIKVGHCDASVTDSACTECASFRLG